MLEKILKRDRFSQVLDGKQCDLFFLKNKKGAFVAVTNYGARIAGLAVPDKTGSLVDVVMGFDSLEKYLGAECAYHGATIGRFANRIAKSTFHLNEKKYSLTPNEGVNHLHGGPHGFHNVVWSPSYVSSDSVELHYHSKDHEEGYPGNLYIKVRFHLNEENDFRIDYEAKSDELTILNLTNHSFFNLNGENNGTIDNHLLKINADYYTPIDDQLIPTGKIAEVEGTPFDFRNAKKIGTQEYDHNFVLSPLRYHGIDEALSLKGDKSGIEMIVYTSEPGLQFYSGNLMKGHDTFKGGMKENFRSALALETQHFPDSPNHQNFTVTKLSPEKTFYSTSIYQFRTGQ